MKSMCLAVIRSGYSDFNLIRRACNSLSATNANLIIQFAAKSLVNAHQIACVILTSNFVSYSALSANPVNTYNF